MTKGLSNAISYVEKNIDKPVEELAEVIRPYTDEICMYDAMNHCCAYDRMETLQTDNMAQLGGQP